MSDLTALSRIAQLLEVFSVLSAAGLNIAGSRALLFIGMASSNYKSPLLPSVIEVAMAIKMSPSGTSRLLSNLLESGDPLISSDKGIKDSRSEAFFLTPRGKRLIESALALLYEDDEDIKIEPLDLSTYARSKYIDRNGHSDVSLKEWQDLIVKTSGDHPQIRKLPHHGAMPVESRHRADPEHVLDHIVVNKFTNRSQALLFLCTNCLPLKPRDG